MSQQLSTNTFGCAKWIVSSNATQGTHTTLAGAMASASSGDTIFLVTSVTENVTITPGVNITAWTGGTANTPSITGTLTMTGAGTSTISGLELITNSAAIISVTGSAASILNINNCYLNCTNNTGITFSTSSGSAAINISYCNGDLGTTGIAYFSHSSAGNLKIKFGEFTNSGSSTTANTVSAGTLNMKYVNFVSPITSSSTGGLELDNIIMNLSSINTTAIIHGGSNSSVRSVQFSQLGSGSASVISIGATMNVSHCDINSSNTNAITGAGTINYQGLTFSGSSSTINTTTQSVSGTLQGSKNTAPTAGMLGEQMRSATTSGLSTGTPTSLTSLSLTPGIWNISGLGSFNNTAGVMSACQLGIGTTNNSFTGCVEGDSQLTITATAINTNLITSIPDFRVILSSTTTYYLVTQQTALSGTLSVAGRISATRIG